MPDTVDTLFLDFQAALAGRYSLERELGRGGMGIVYLAREIRLDRPVAIKLLPPPLAAHGPLRDRFLREARIAAKLSHPHIVPIHAVDEVASFVFFAMAYVDGPTLAQRIAARGPLPAYEAARVVREVAWALAYAHQKGIVHRDIKSENILLEPGTRRALVADFGIARLQDAIAGPEGVVGTPAFMSPEQAAGDPLDGRSDLYSLGVVAFHALTGTLPFNGSTAAAVMGQHLKREAPPVTDLAPATPESLVRIVARCLAKQPVDRVQSGEELAGELAALEVPEQVPTPVRVLLRSFPRRVAAIAIGLLPLVPFLKGAFDASVGVGALIGVAVLFAAWRVARVAFLALPRRVLRAGHGYEDVVASVRRDLERRREELAFQYTREPERWVRVMSFLGVGFGALTLAAGLLVPGMRYGWLDWVLGAGLLIAGASGLAHSARRDLGLELTARFWAGFPGRWIFRWAGVAPGTKRPLATSRTEVAIGAAAEALFVALPRDLQRAVGSLPAVLRRLETRVSAARRRRDEVDQALGALATSPARNLLPEQLKAFVADLRRQKDAAVRQQDELIAALETIRLDVLRLRAGSGNLESITAAIAAAERIGQAADRAIAARPQRDLSHA